MLVWKPVRWIQEIVDLLGSVFAAAARDGFLTWGLGWQ
jgi:hypothetical protein